MTIRLGVVRDIDLLPLLYPIEAGWAPTPAVFDLRAFDHPELLDKALAEGTIDAAFAPPTTYAAQRDNLVILSRPARVYDMAGNNAFLVSAQRIDRSETPSVSLSQATPLGVVLFKLLASPYFGINPIYSEVPDDAAALAAPTDGHIIGTDAGLRQKARAEQLYAEEQARREAEDEAEAAEAEAAENDETIEFIPRRKRREAGEAIYVEDLSKAWWILTNNPLPLNLMLARRDWALVNTPEGLAITPGAVALADLLTNALTQSSEHMDSIVTAGAKSSGIDEETLRAHFTAQRYTLNDTARRGLTEFYSKASAARLLPSVGLSIAELG